MTLAQAQERAKGFQVGLIRVEKYFEGTNISAYAGPPPKSEGKEYCWGGCPGAIEEAIEILRKMDAELDRKMPRLHVVFGNYQGPLAIGEGEQVVFIGDCATWEGKIGKDLVSIKSLYKTRDTLDPHTIKADEIVSKIMKTSALVREGKKKGYIRMTGCPVSVTEQLMLLVQVSGVKDPVRDFAGLASFLKWKTVMAGKTMLGHKYQVHGATKRGDAAPDVKT